ncbi:NAD-glutamate dehydrogenase [Maricaulis sp.]|uniref:NAD-glutamate dehydrogenase n=1 Tax=Maricaulis sp. TaxID=1486257 RepID=UPI00262808D3|nr:NAD-glutamate dehydrogenase [Maricaulis sp.]
MGAVVGVAHAYSRAEFMEAARRRWQERFGAECGEIGNSFFSQIFDDALSEDLERVSVEDLAALALDFWEFGVRRPGDDILVRMRPAVRVDGTEMPRSILEIVGRDRPFIVDSVMAEIGAQGHDIIAMFHPIVQCRRGSDGDRVETGGRILPESMIQVHLPPLDELSQRTLIEGVSATLDDVRVAVEDWTDMRAQMDEAIAHLENATTRTAPEELQESLDFLRWLRDDHFAFLGCRVYDFEVNEDGSMADRHPRVREETGRGVLRDPDRHVLRKGSEPAVLTPAIETFLREPTPLIVAKANMKSRVHRRVYMDYIGVKRYREDGAVIGEARFVGLFTAEAYDQSASAVPLIRRKVRRVLERAGKTPGTHNAKKLRNTVENYPRDELFQTDEDDLLEVSLGVLHLNDRPRTKLFLRRDQFDRFVSALLYVPRDRYNSKVREQAGELIREAFDGRLSAYYPQFGDSPLARVHFIIGLNPFDHPEPDTEELERRVARLARTWEDDFETHVRRNAPEKVRLRARAYDGAFKAGYRELYDPEEALADVLKIESLDNPQQVAVRVYREPEDGDHELRLKIYRIEKPVSLSRVMPVLENLGLLVVQETGFPVDRRGADGASNDRAYVHDFEMKSEAIRGRDLNEIGPVLEEALLAMAERRAEDDGFNRLIVEIGVNYREAAFLRTCARYRQQTGLDPSQAIQEEALATYPDIARGLLELTRVKFDPTAFDDDSAREQAIEATSERLREALDAVPSLDHDRALRRIFHLIEATLRTNFYQRDADGQPKSRISIKIASEELEELPLPKPYREIFVWAPDVEGVHIRFGPVARGGLRWSDRRDDFRTEVLGLVKAQQVKNAVIVPVGSKGGFYPKMLPRGGSRDEVFEAGREAYKTFIRGLLDLTDNIVDDVVIRPADTLAWDAEDPYLVVAADKGTATFSDTANGLAEDEFDFWLGDAFASGGSAGYDHKKMGITARGAWESVKRHFRELGKDIQSEPFTVIGVGDMSGDVFGNGMLLSKQIRLVAAFDHRDIFIDPDPADPERLWDERKRLFDLGRSSWQDYDKSLISKGGGIFPRASKAITLTPEIKALTGLKAEAVSPTDLITALLKSPSELLWFGGIGTYVKATHEQHWEVGDKTNDALRINAVEVGAKVIGEGANLGFTQEARIEFCKHGGRANADFVDNSAGVDSSDHEVNIKILLRPMVRGGEMARDVRDSLLESMTDNVADNVLKHNYEQTLALTLAERTAVADLDAHERFMSRLEDQGLLDREVEFLPNSEAVRALKERGAGLTRPELAVLLSYAKITLFDQLVACDVPDDPHFTDMLVNYFPNALHKFSDNMQGHRLKREIISTVLANEMINLGGPTFIHRAIDSTTATVPSIARAFEAGRQIFGYADLTDRINKLDNIAPASVQMQLHEEIIRLLRRQTYWIVRRNRNHNPTKPEPISSVIEAYRPGVQQLRSMVHEIISNHERKGVAARRDGFVEAGAPEDLAQAVAELRPLTSSTDVIDMALTSDWPLASTAYLYHAMGARFRFDRLRGKGQEVVSELHWDRLAVRRLMEDFYASQQACTASAMRFALQAGGSLAAGVENPDRDWADALVEAWNMINEEEAGRVDMVQRQLDSSGPWTLSKLAIASTQLGEMAAVAEPQG